ncbi:MAG: hypothetical protein ACK4LA_06705, partial [Aquificaceae bacterium]
SCGNNTTCTINIDANKTCTATFNTSGGGGGGGGGGSGGGSGGDGTTGSSGGGGGGCSMSAGASPINALFYLLVPFLVALRRLARR